MAAKSSKPSELTDIPLTLAQGDSVELNAAKSEKLKTNSLKRFFRTARGGMPTSSSTDTPDISGIEDEKITRSIHLRFGSFSKHDENNNMEASSSPELLQSKLPADSRLSLQARFSSYLTNVFKKSSKKSDKVKSQINESTSTDIQEIEENQSDNL